MISFIFCELLGGFVCNAHISGSELPRASLFVVRKPHKIVGRYAKKLCNRNQLVYIWLCCTVCILRYGLP